MQRPQFESSTTTALERVSQSGKQGDTVLLSSLTEHSWDQVYYFSEGTPQGEVNAQVGRQVVSGNGYLQQPGPLLVFVRDGTVTEAVYALPPLSLASKGNVFSVGTATIRLRTKPPAPHGLTLE